MNYPVSSQRTQIDSKVANIVAIKVRPRLARITSLASFYLKLTMPFVFGKIAQ
jgi:hypothetical protein